MIVRCIPVRSTVMPGALACEEKPFPIAPRTRNNRNMPLSKEHKARTRERIIDSAASLFRQSGMDGVSIEQVMKNAGLTHGGFYAHFKSKTELFVEVIRTRHDLIRRLEAREDTDVAALNRAGREIFANYLDETLQPKISPNCTLSTLNMEAARSSREAREAFTQAVRRLHYEIVRSGTAPGRQMIAHKISSMAIGAMAIARVTTEAEEVAAILGSAKSQIDQWFLEILD